MRICLISFLFTGVFVMGFSLHTQETSEPEITLELEEVYRPLMNYYETEKVLEASLGSFKVQKEEFQDLLVYFYLADYRRHSPDVIISNFNDVARRVAEKYPQLKVVATSNFDYIFSDSEVRYGSTFSLYVTGFQQPVSYQGGWSASDIVDWVDRTMKALTGEVKTIEEIQEIVDHSEVVALFVANDNLSVYPSIINSVTTAPDYNFYACGDVRELEGNINFDSVWDDTVFIYSKNSLVKEFYRVKGDTLILFDRFNQTQKILEGPFRTESVRKFMGSINTMIKISRLQWSTRFNLLNTSMSTIFLVRSDDEVGYQTEKAFREAVSSLRDKMLIYIFKSDSRYQGSKDLDLIFPVSAHDMPAIRILHPAKIILKYPYQKGNFTVDGIKNFVDKFLAGNLIPFFSSDPLPVNEYEDNVRVVVGETFEKIVLDEQKDVLLLMPDSHNPVFLRLMAEKFKDIEDFVLAIMNPKTNEVDGIKRWQNIYQARFYPKNLKHSPIIVNQRRPFGDMPTNINVYIQFFKRYAFIARERQSQLPDPQYQPFDIISWAEKEPHPLCANEYIHRGIEAQDQSKNTDIVLSVVESNFSKIVLDEENDVFLVAYTPEDDITKILRLATQLKDEKNLVFAKIDSSVNEVAGVKQCSTPTYWLYQRSRKHAPIKYETRSWLKEEYLVNDLRLSRRILNIFGPEDDSEEYYITE